jgi:hypothetical protein
MVHHDPDCVVICERFGREIAEHPQMAMLAVQAIFRRVMGMKSGHGFAAVQTEYIALCRAQGRDLPRISVAALESHSTKTR